MQTKTKAELESENDMLYGQLEAIHEQISEILYATCDNKDDAGEDDDDEEDHD